jgi:hypothetical protein
VKKYRSLIIIGVGILFLVITNPSIKDFKDYIGVNTYDGLHKNANFFVCSTFKYDNNERDYLGIAGNVFILPKRKIETLRGDSTVSTDSAKMDSSSILPEKSVPKQTSGYPITDSIMKEILKKHHKK